MADPTLADILGEGDNEKVTVLTGPDGTKYTFDPKTNTATPIQGITYPWPKVEPPPAPENVSSGTRAFRRFNPATGEYEYEDNPYYNADPTGSSARQAGQFAQTMGQNQQEFAYKQQQDELERQRQERTDALAKQQQAWRVASDLIAQKMQAAPMALLPGQTHFVGYEPGGIAEQNARELGRPYNPDRFKVPVMDYDPEEAWRRAASLMGNK